MLFAPHAPGRLSTPACGSPTLLHAEHGSCFLHTEPLGQGNRPHDPREVLSPEGPQVKMQKAPL